MKNIFLKLALAVVLSFALAGCMPAVGNKIDSVAVSHIIKGKTTKQEVIAIWGQPMMKTYAGDGEHWVYAYQGVIHVLSAFSGPETQSLSIHFSGDIVQDYIFSTDVEGQAPVSSPIASNASKNAPIMAGPLAVPTHSLTPAADRPRTKKKNKK